MWGYFFPRGLQFKRVEGKLSDLTIQEITRILPNLGKTKVEEPIRNMTFPSQWAISILPFLEDYSFFLMLA